MTEPSEAAAPPELEGWLRDYLACVRPSTALLLCSGEIPQALAELVSAPAGLQLECRRGVRDLSGLDGVGRFDVAIVLGEIETLSLKAGRLLVARLRDLHAARVCVALSEETLEPWRDDDWRAIEFLPAGHAVQSGGRIRLFTYDLATYNAERSWNNAEQWAHPGNFDRFRW